MSTNLFDIQGYALEDGFKKIVLAKGTTVPTDATAGFLTGCVFLKTNGAGGTSTYINEGTSTSCAFHAIGNASVTNQAATSTTDGLTTGIIDPSSSHVTVTSSSGSNIVTLPAPVVGKKITIDVGANGFKLQTTAPATIGINGGTGASAKSTIAASSTLYMICVSATSWKGYFLDADSDVAKVPAAA